MKILFITHSAQNCGVADYGLRVFDILKKQGFDITLCQAQSESDINYTGYDVALYNYHHATLPFLTGTGQTGIKQIALYHEAFMHFQPDVIIPVPELPRPLFEDHQTPSVSNPLPTIGSFGFGFPDKNFPGLCQLVREQFSAAIIRLHIPFAQYGDDKGTLAMHEIDKCRAALAGSNITLNVTHHFFTQAQMLYWLSCNDINIFNYAPSHGRGLSSTIDYALSVSRPIGVSSSEMFRHLPNEICLDNITIPQLINNGIQPLQHVYDDNTNAKLAEKIKSYF